MKTLLILEEAAKLLVSFLGCLYLGFDWWVFPALLLLPDLSMIGYLAGPGAGAWLYNFFHHQAVAIGVGVTGVLINIPELQLAGLLLFGHSAMDRAFGYGLKYPDHFKHTHLGWIGQKEKEELVSR